MSSRILLVAVVLAVVCGAGRPQVPGSPPVTKAPAPPVIEGRFNESPSPAYRRASAPPVETQSLDQLLGELEALRAQQAELLKKEQELTRAIQKKVGEQAARLQRLGLAPIAPDRVGTIKIEGAPGKREKEILDLVKIHPGQVLNYPALEESRARLIKAGYPAAEVLVQPHDMDSNFKDVLIRVGDKVTAEADGQKR